MIFLISIFLFFCAFTVGCLILLVLFAAILGYGKKKDEQEKAMRGDDGRNPSEEKKVHITLRRGDGVEKRIVVDLDGGGDIDIDDIDPDPDNPAGGTGGKEIRATDGETPRPARQTGNATEKSSSDPDGVLATAIVIIAAAALIVILIVSLFGTGNGDAKSHSVAQTAPEAREARRDQPSPSSPAAGAEAKPMDRFPSGDLQYVFETNTWERVGHPGIPVDLDGNPVAVEKAVSEKEWDSKSAYENIERIKAESARAREAEKAARQAQTAEAAKKTSDKGDAVLSNLRHTTLSDY